jgi:hypothetical protein
MKTQIKLLIALLVLFVFSFNFFILAFYQKNTDEGILQVSTFQTNTPIDSQSPNKEEPFIHSNSSTTPNQNLSTIEELSLLTGEVPSFHPNLLKKHLKSSDFFNLERHRTPKVSESTKCELLSYGIFPEEDSMYFISKPFSCLRPSEDVVLDENFVIPCEQNPLIYVPKAEDNNFIGGGDYPNRWVNKKSVALDGAEFALGKCGTRYFAMVRNVYKAKAATRAKELTEKIMKNQGNTGKSKNFNFILLVVDSMSRQNFYRNMKNTAKYLKQELNSDYVVYDFLLNNAEAPTTVQNLSPLFLGERFDPYLKKVNGKHGDINDLPKFISHQNQSALWVEFEKHGFVSMFSTESYNDFISAATGRKVLTDHVLGTFWKVSGKELKFVEFSTTAQCIAGKMPHDYSLKYSKDFMKNYEKNNRATFLVINTAHEETCTRIKTLDDPMKNYLKWALEENEADETMIVLMGDHGRYFKAVTLDSYVEKFLPAHFVIASKSFVNRVGIDKGLEMNQDKFLARLDWYETLKFLPQMIYQEKPADSSKILEFKKTLQHPAVNLFYEVAKDERDCFSLGIDKNACVCKTNLLEIKDAKSFEDFVKNGIDIINQVVKEKNFFEKCGKITFKKVLRSESYKVSKDFNEDVKVFAEVDVEGKKFVLVFCIFYDYERALMQGLNLNKKLVMRTSILDRINKIQGNKFKVYNVFIDGEALDLGLPDDLNYLCRK